MDRIKKSVKWLYIFILLVSVLPLVCRFLFCTEPIIDWSLNLKIFLIQTITLLGTYLMYRTFSNNQLAVLLGVTLYMTSPYRIDLCYVQEDVMLSATWALVPMYLYGVLKVKEKGFKGIGYIIFSAVILAMIGYGSGVMFFIMLALTLLVATVFRKVVLLLPVFGGGLLWIPGNMQFLMYLFTDRLTDLQYPIINIAPTGYSFSDFLTSYIYLEGKPGLGLGFLIAAAVYAYVRVVSGGGRLNWDGKLFGTVGLLSLFLATRYFPWELVQRVGTWALKFVSMIETPVLFAGFAALLLPVVFGSVVDELELAEERIPARGSLVIIWVASVGIAIYHCYMLTYKGL